MSSVRRLGLKWAPSRPVPITEEKSPNSAQENDKSAQIVLDFYKKCLKFRNSARKLLADTVIYIYLYIFLVLTF